MPSDGRVTGWRQVATLVFLIAGLCVVFGTSRVIPIWSILTTLWGLLQIGQRTLLRWSKRP